MVLERDGTVPAFQGVSPAVSPRVPGGHTEPVPRGHLAQLRAWRGRWESNSFLWKEVKILAFAALDPTVDVFLASGEAGVFAKLLGSPVAYRGSGSLRGRRG